MKTIKSTLILSVAIAAAAVAIGAAYAGASKVKSLQAQGQVVTISAKRMSEAEKLAYDTQGGPVQTVVIAAKRLSAEQKLAMAQEEQRSWHNVALLRLHNRSQG